MKRILIRGLNRIGDALYTLPAIKRLRQAYPDAEITILSKPGVKPIYEYIPYIDETITLGEGFLSRTRLIKLLRKKGFDMALLLHNSFESALLAALSGISVRVGYRRELRGPLLTHSLEFPREPIHRVEYNMRLLKLIGIDATAEPPELFLSSEELRWAKDFKDKYLKDRYVIGLIVGSKAKTRRWFPERFATLAQRTSDALGAKIVIIGGKDDMDVAVAMKSNIKGDVIDLTGRLSLRQTMAILKVIDVVVANDTGPMHLAALSGTPTIAIFGAGNLIETKPLGPRVSIISKDIECSGCVREKCPRGTLECLRLITVDEVFEEVLKWLKTY